MPSLKSFKSPDHVIQHPFPYHQGHYLSPTFSTGKVMTSAVIFRFIGK